MTPAKARDYIRQLRDQTFALDIAKQLELDEVALAHLTQDMHALADVAERALPSCEPAVERLRAGLEPGASAAADAVDMAQTIDAAGSVRAVVHEAAGGVANSPEPVVANTAEGVANSASAANRVKRDRAGYMKSYMAARRARLRAAREAAP